MTTYLSRAELRKIARERLSGSWGKAVLLTFVNLVIVLALNRIPRIGGLLETLVSGVLTMGSYRFYLLLVRRENPSVATLFDGFKQFGRVFLLWLLMFVFTFLWALLLLVPGIIAALRYSQAYFILNDNPDITPLEAINRSKELMQGHKWRYFVLGLSFIGWLLLAILTVGIGVLWLTPYITATYAVFYENLVQHSVFKQDWSGAGQAGQAPPAPGTF